MHTARKFVLLQVLDFQDGASQAKFTALEQDDPGQGALSYTEFFISLYNFCSLSHEALVRFTFALMDTDNSGSITKDELISMIEMLHDANRSDGKDANVAAKQIRKIMAVLDANKSGSVSLREFLQCNRRVSSLMQPAFKLQAKMRKRCMTSSFWNRATRQRAKTMRRAGANGDDLVELYKRVEADERRKKREAEASEQARRVIGLDGQPVLLDPQAVAARQAAEIEAKMKTDARVAALDEVTDKMRAVEEKYSNRRRRKEKAVGRRKGDWWTEGDSEVHERTAASDNPHTISVNGPKRTARYQIETETADHLIRANHSRDHAEMLRKKNQIAKEELRTMIQAIAAPEVINGEVVPPPKKGLFDWHASKKRKKRRHVVVPA